MMQLASPERESTLHSPHRHSASLLPFYVDFFGARETFGRFSLFEAGAEKLACTERLLAVFTLVCFEAAEIIAVLIVCQMPETRWRPAIERVGPKTKQIFTGSCKILRETQVWRSGCGALQCATE